MRARAGPFDPVQRGPATKTWSCSTATAFQIIERLWAARMSVGLAASAAKGIAASRMAAAAAIGLLMIGPRRRRVANAQKPESTSLPTLRPLSTAAWARLRLAALIEP